MTVFQIKPTCLRQAKTMAAFAGFWLIAGGDTTLAGTIRKGNVTTELGPTFFIDDTSIGGTDAITNQPAIASYTRSFTGLLTPQQGAARLVLTGFAFATAANATHNDATNLAVTITYLGADEAVGGGDDVLIGSETGTYDYDGNGEYLFAFDAPMAADLIVTGTRFRIQVAPSNADGNGSVMIKSGPLLYETTAGPKLSVAGFVTPQRLNLAKFQPVTTSSSASQRLASYLTDGNAGNDNRWQSTGSGPHWARVDFPFPVEIGSAQVFTGFDDTNAQASFQIQYLDGESWLNVPGAAITGNTNVERNIVFTSAVTSSAFRIRSTDGTLRVRELALYPPNGGSGHPLGTDLRVNLARQRPTTATARTTGNFALLAVDGRVNEASKWQTSTAGIQSLEIDLRVSGKIGSAHLYSGSSGVVPLADFDLKYWNGSAWQIIPGAAIIGNTSDAIVIPFTTPVTTSRLLLEFTNPGTTSIRELCVFPANEGNTGYPLGTGVTGLPALTAKVEDYRDSFHFITNAAANRAMAVGDGVPQLNQSALTLANRQYQILLNLDSGTYRLRNRATGLCLSGAQLSLAPGAPLLDAPYTALPHQDWILARVSATDFCFVNQWSGLVIDTQGSATTEGTPLVQNLRNGSPTQSWQIAHSTHSPKKGVGGTTLASSLNANWAYNWGLSNSNPLPARTEFHPMQWGNYNWNFDTTASSIWKSYPAWRSAGYPLHLLGFNEPDKVEQSGLSLDPETNNANLENFSPTRSMQTAVTLWPRLEAMDQPMVSPAPAGMTNGWLADFYTNADTLGYRVDYTALHSYPGPSGGSANNLINTLLTGYNTWGRPVWLTEFSFVNWSGTGTWTEEDNYNCLAEFIWRAESLPWIHKYALFVFREAGTGTNNPPSPAPEHPWSPVGPRSNAIDLNGNLTAFGKLYAAWDGDASVRTDKIYHIHHKDSRKRLANNTAQSNVAGRNIRVDGKLVHWTLVAAPTAERYYIVSSLDGRRLSTDGTTVSLVAAETTGTEVQWSLTEQEHGWHFLEHPASAKRLKMAYNNSNLTATYSMVANSNEGNDVQWRFIVPPSAPVWSGTVSNSWTDAPNWFPGVVPASGETVAFTASSTNNLSTMLDQDFSLSGISLSDPSGPVSIGGTQSLTLGAGGFDLSAASQNLTVTTPLILSAAQNWSVAAGRVLSLNGGVSGAFQATVNGAGAVSLGSLADPLLPLTISPGGTLRMGASGLLASGISAVNPVINGTLDLNGTTQSINGMGGSGIIDNTAAGTAQLTVGNNDAAVTLNSLVQNTGGALTLIKVGAGNLSLGGANTFSGGFVNNGTGNINSSNPAGINACFGTGPVVANAGTLYLTTQSWTFDNALTLNGGTLRVGGGTGKSITWSGPVSVTADSEIRADGSTAGITLSGGVTNNGFTLSSAPNSTTNTISGPISGTGTIMASTFANGTLNLNAANPFTGTYRSALGTLRIGDPLALQHGTLDMNAADSGSVNLNNLSATIGALTGTRNLGLGSGTVSIGNNHSDTSFSGILSGNGSLVKIGNGTLTLAGPNNYIGTTSVNAGTLALGANHTLPDTALSIGDATLDAATFTDTIGTLHVTATTAKINLAEGAALSFADSSEIDWTGGGLSLTGTFVPGVSLRFGTHSGGLTSTQLGLISATGFTNFALTPQGYLTAVVPGTYTAWQAANSTAGGMNEDHDDDGVPNGIEHFLGGSSNTTGFTALPGVMDTGGTLSVTWIKSDGYTGVYPTDFVVETSETLDGAWSAETLGDSVMITGNEVKFTFPAGTKIFARLKVTGQ